MSDLAEKDGWLSDTMCGMSEEIAYFATGCFWGAERRFWQMPGVIRTSVGYMGGKRSNPNYEQVCTGITGHTETVEVVFDPKEIDYERLLAEFWTMHDPTSLNRQGNDIGTQYRSAIFTTSAEQRESAIASQSKYQVELDKEGIGQIVTEISDASQYPYYLAEEYHQKYLMKNPNGYDCHSSTGVAYPIRSIKEAQR
jgi:peptide-methionine (S)-S-oxide reductase